MKTFSFLLAFALLALLTGCSDETDLHTHGDKYAKLNTDMRVLWSDHALWTRNVIINIIDDLPGTTEAVNRLLKNQEDIGNAIKPYYGEAGGDALTTLLKEHITIAADLLVAAKTSDSEGFDNAHALWYQNGDDIAAFLNAANPEHFQLSEWQQMMKTHLDLTLEEAVARLTKDYTADVIAYDKVYAELMMMADMLTEGIAEQFPDKF